MGKTLEGEHRLQFVQPSMMKREWALQSETGEVLGTLTVPSMWRERALVDVPGARLELERRLTWRGYRLFVRSVGTGAVLATFHQSAWAFGGKLVIEHTQRAYEWASNFWGTLWSWRTPGTDAPVLGFEPGGLFTSHAQIAFDTADRETVMLVFVGWYLYLLSQTDSAALAGV